METLLLIGGHIGAFLLGVVFGVAYERYRGKNSKEIEMKHFISFMIFVLWTISIGKNISTGVWDTPLILHVFFGAVVGGNNKEFGEYFLKILGK